MHVRGWSYLTRNELLDLIVERNRIVQTERQLRRERQLAFNRILNTRRVPWYLHDHIRDFDPAPGPAIPPLHTRMEEDYLVAPIDHLRYIAQQQGYTDVDRLTRTQLMRRLMRDV